MARKMWLSVRKTLFGTNREIDYDFDAEEDRATFFFDGACKGNGDTKAVGGAGAHLDRFGEGGSRETMWADSSGFQFGANSTTRITNNIAELRGVEMVANRLAYLAALDVEDPVRARALGGVRKVYVVGDSEFVVKMLRGEQTAKQPTLVSILRGIQRTFRQAERSLGVQVIYQWVPREMNTKADALANEGVKNIRAGNGGPDPQMTQQQGTTPGGDSQPTPSDPPSPRALTALAEGQIEGSLYSGKFEGRVAYCMVLGSRYESDDPKPWIMVEWLLCGTIEELWPEDLDGYKRIVVPGGDLMALKRGVTYRSHLEAMLARWRGKDRITRYREELANLDVEDPHHTPNLPLDSPASPSFLPL
jgi:ribonuclease HI